MTRYHNLAFHWLLIIVVLLVAFWLRSHALNDYPPGISNDEAVNVVDSFHIHRSGIAPAYEDKGRPEPTYRIVTAFAMWAMGDTVWVARLSGVLWSMVTLAAIYWLASEAIADADKPIRRVTGLVALIAMSMMIGHITFSRALYRAIPQLLFVTLSAGFILRGLRTTHWRDFALAGFFGAIALYTYPVAFFYPPALVVLGLSLAIFRLGEWRVWLPRMALAALIAGLVSIPLIYLYLANPDAILARAQDVASGQARDWSRILDGFVQQFLTQGDENPQYNAALAPIIPPLLQPMFYLGLIALFMSSLKPSSWFIASMLVLFAIPVLASNEITHGLRVSSEYIVVPVIIGLGVGTFLQLISPLQHLAHKKPTSLSSLREKWPILAWGYPAVIIAAISVLGYGSITAWHSYQDYWENPGKWQLWRIFEERLDHNEWFFRTDRRYFSEWLVVQDFPILIPVEEVNRQTTRTWLLRDYPDVTTANTGFVLPDNTHLVVPYELGLGDIMRETRQYALLHDGTITLLPPLSVASHQTLLSDIESGQRIEGAGVVLTFWGYDKAIPENFELEFESDAITATQSLAIFGNDEVHLNSWYGATPLSDQEKLAVTLIWSPSRQLRHEYQAVVQVQTQDFERIAGDNDFEFIQRWVYPSTIWQVGDSVPDTHIFALPADLQAGAYRLVTGIKYTNHLVLDASSNVGETVNNLATIGWLKVPQEEIPEIPDSAIALDVVVDDRFRLVYVEVIPLTSGQSLVKLYLQGLVDRPEIDATIFVHATDSDGQIVAQSDLRPWDGQYPTFIWDEGEIVVSEHMLSTENLDLSALNLRIGMYVFPGPQNLQAIVDDEIVESGLIELGTIADYIAE